LLPENAPRKMCGAQCKYCQRPTGDVAVKVEEEAATSPKSEELKSTTSKVDWKRTALATQRNYAKLKI
jgi:wyosine [tRNA(Phe)-imidazoG37] synthetase (radical SAM superfamily)